MENVTQMACETCQVQLVAVERKKSISAGGLIGAFIFFIGLLMLLWNVLFGLLVMILGAVIGMAGRGSQLVMICPQCRKEVTRI